MDEQKVIYVRRGQVLTVECLQDGITNGGYFLVKDLEDRTTRAVEIVVGDVLYTTDETKRKFSKNGLEYEIYIFIKKIESDPNPLNWRLKKSTFDGIEKRCILVNDLTAEVNDQLGLKNRGVTPRTMTMFCRTLGFRIERTGMGFAVILDNSDLLAIGSRFVTDPDVAFAPGDDLVDGDLK